MEHIINVQLIDYLLSNSLITKHQHGFLLKHSTCSNLLETANDWTLALDNHLNIDVIYIDFQKAFNSVSQPKLLSKLTSYNIGGDLFACITAFLDHRSQYINNLTDGFANLNCAIELYADDAKLYCSYKLGDYSATLVKALARTLN